MDAKCKCFTSRRQARNQEPSILRKSSFLNLLALAVNTWCIASLPVCSSTQLYKINADLNSYQVSRSEATPHENSLWKNCIVRSDNTNCVLVVPFFSRSVEGKLLEEATAPLVDALGEPGPCMSCLRPHDVTLPSPPHHTHTHTHTHTHIRTVKHNPQTGNLRALVKILLELAGTLRDESKCER